MILLLLGIAILLITLVWDIVVCDVSCEVITPAPR